MTLLIINIVGRFDDSHNLIITDTEGRFLRTINVTLFLKMRDINFFWWGASYYMVHCKGYFEGDMTFLTPKLSIAQRYIAFKKCLLEFTESVYHSIKKGLSKTSN